MLTRQIKPREEGLPGLTEEDMTLIPKVIKLMTPLKTVTKCLNEEKTPTISIIAPTLAKLQEDFEPDDSDLPVISEVEKFRQDFDSRYTYIQDLLNTSSALDPHLKDLEFLDDDNTGDTIFPGITAEVENMVGKCSVYCSQCLCLPLTFTPPYFTVVFICFSLKKSNSLSLLIIVRQRTMAHWMRARQLNQEVTRAPTERRKAMKRRRRRRRRKTRRQVCFDWKT